MILNSVDLQYKHTELNFSEVAKWGFKDTERVKMEFEGSTMVQRVKSATSWYQVRICISTEKKPLWDWSRAKLCIFLWIQNFRQLSQTPALGLEARLKSCINTVREAWRKNVSHTSLTRSPRIWYLYYALCCNAKIVVSFHWLSLLYSRFLIPMKFL